MAISAAYIAMEIVMTPTVTMTTLQSSLEHTQ
jgi:hypothetical protein